MKERILGVRERIDAAVKRSGRTEGSVLLVAISKTFPAEAVVEAARAGLSTFGENRVQEAAAKIPRVAELLASARMPPPTWHLVGHLQSNKARQAVALFDLVHSVDSAGLAAKLEVAAASCGKRLPVLIQVNVSGEGSKSGVEPGSLRALVDAVATCSHLELRGLMTIPPYDPDPERSRPHFAALRELGERVRGWLGPGADAGELSMGMTEDFEIAVEEGATIVRVGRALFGERAA